MYASGLNSKLVLAKREQMANVLTSDHDVLTPSVHIIGKIASKA